MNTRAKWVQNIPDLYDNLAEAANYLTVAQVSLATGLAAETITDLLSRRPITSTTNPQGPLSRPARRIGNRPLYSREQVDRAVELLRNANPRHFGGGEQALPSVSYDEATRRNLLSTEEIAQLATADNATGVHEQTVRRWARDRADFPPRVALRARQGGHPGVPMVVYDGEQAIKWLVDHGYCEGPVKAVLTKVRQMRAQRSAVITTAAS